MANWYEQRIKRLRRSLAEQGSPQAILISNPVNVTYLSGFTGDSSFLVVTAKRSILISDSRYETQIAEECPGLDVEIRDAKRTTLQLVGTAVNRLELNAIAIEASSVTLADYDGLRSSLKTCELVPTLGVVEELRAVKDADEIRRIERSIAINERAFQVIRAQLRGDQTEREVAHNLEHQMRAFGASQCAFKPIVGVGPRAALPHGTPSSRRIEESPFVLIDWGAQVDGYCSDLTRVLVTGKHSSRLEKVYEVVFAAQRAAIREIRPGVPFKTVDEAARNVIAEAGFAKRFGHGLGHGFGLQIHELPFVSPIREGLLEENMVLTVEPGIYLPDVLGVRIEDDVLVTSDGHRVLSSLPSDFDSCRVAI